MLSVFSCLEVAPLERFQFRFGLLDLGVEGEPTILLLFLLLGDPAIGRLLAVEQMHGQFDGQVPVVFLDLAIAACLARLLLQLVEVVLDLEEQVFDAVEVVLGRLELVEGLALADLVLGDPGGLLEHLPAGIVLVVQQVVEHTQLDDGVGVAGNARVEKEAGDVLEPAGHVVQPVFALPGAEIVTGNGDGAEFRREDVGRVLESERHFGQAGGFACLRSVEDQVFHALGAQVAGTLLTEHPSDGVDDVGFAAAVGAHHTGDALVEMERGLVGEALEAFDLETGQFHVPEGLNGQI